MSTPQAPLPSGFGAQTTGLEVVRGSDLSGLTAIVTGGHAGIGLETTRALTQAGATVIVGARSLEKAHIATASLVRVKVEVLDLFDPPSVDIFAARFLASGVPLDILINNAGVMATPLVRDARGFDSQLATNHLGHFQLTARLWPALKRASNARVVSLSSIGHRRAAMDFDDPHFARRPYDKWVAYGQSKTANALFAVGLDARGEPHGVRAFSVHPGAIITEIMRSLSDEEARVAVERLNAVSTLKTAEQGAATSVWCATSRQLEGMGGVYCENVDIAEAVAADFSGPSGVRPWAVDVAAADRLWKLSEEWTGVTLKD